MKHKIWMSGSACNGAIDRARFCGEFEGETFSDACKEWAKTLDEPHFFDAERNTFWGCGLYDNEVDAREGFG